MELKDYFKPFNYEDLRASSPLDYFEEGSWYHALMDKPYSIEDEDIKIVFIGIEEEGSDSEEAFLIRKYLYNLKKTDLLKHALDIGNFVTDYSLKSFQTLGFALSELVLKGIHPIILNGKNRLFYAQYLCYNYTKKYVNVLGVDSRVDFNLLANPGMTDRNYLQHILTDEPSYIFHLIHLGHQSYFETPENISFMKSLHFEMVRLGEVRSDLDDVENYIRNAHCMYFDLSSIRYSDFPATSFPSPNGLLAEEACKIAYYAGKSEQISSFGFYGYRSLKDNNEQSAHLLAQMIWFVLEGFSVREHENPIENRADFLKFITNSQHKSNQIIFYKSQKTNRWWVEIPMASESKSLAKQLIPCSYKDYEIASNEEIPDRWLNAVKRLS